MGREPDLLDVAQGVFAGPLRNNSRVIDMVMVLGARESTFPIPQALMPWVFIPLMAPCSSALN